MKQLQVIVEKHRERYVAYPLGLQGVVVGEGDTFEEALADVKSAINFHLKTFGKQALRSESPVLDAFVVEAGSQAEGPVFWHCR
jgi:predicted RNase H-like HicB family nuclease